MDGDRNEMQDKPVKEFHVDKLKVQIYSNRILMGKVAAQAVGEKMRSLIQKQACVRMIFASAPSQNEFLATLATLPGIDWLKVTAFHMDEYIGIGAGSQQSFGFFIKKHLLEKVPVAQAYYINPKADDPQAECERYASLIKEHPIDIVCMGIGENGHIAFNDPPVADFDDPQVVKIVELEQRCKEQQVHDGCFNSIDEVPKTAITATISTLISGKFLFIIVPGNTKAEAVFNTICGPIETACPASILRKHKNAILYLDINSAARLKNVKYY